MSTHNICFGKEIRKLSVIFGRKKGLIWSNVQPFSLIDFRLVDFFFSIKEG